MTSDSLPYLQLHRAAKPRAALLAGHLGVTNQHALGSLIEFWELCAGDQRDLEDIVAKTPAGQEPAVVLEAADVELRFHLASGHEVRPVVLVRLGLLEPLEGDRFRIRGMSRFFEPISRKMAMRALGSKGGRASATARAAPTPPAQANGQPHAQAAAQPHAQATAQQAVSSEQSAVSSQQSAPTPPVTAFEVEAPDPASIDEWTKEEFWRAGELHRRELGYPPQRWPAPIALSRWWSEARGVADVRQLAQAFQRFAVDAHWSQASPPAPWGAWFARFADFLPKLRAPDSLQRPL